MKKNKSINVLGKKLNICCNNPKTGFFRTRLYIRKASKLCSIICFANHYRSLIDEWSLRFHIKSAQKKGLQSAIYPVDDIEIGQVCSRLPLNIVFTHRLDILLSVFHYKDVSKYFENKKTH